MVLAAEPSDPVSILLQYGVLGVIAALLILYARSSIQRERDKADRAEAEVTRLNEFIRTELLPKQVEQSLIQKQVTEVLQAAVARLTEARIRDEVWDGSARSRRDS